MILFCGDTHGHFSHLIETVLMHRPHALVLLGDVQASRPLEDVLSPILGLTDVWFIHGNHDTDSDADHDHLFGSGLAHRNLHGRVVEIDGLRVAGLGGIFREQVWMPPNEPRFASPQDFIARCGKGNRWRGGLPRKHRSTIFQSDYMALLAQHADVLVTHEAPSPHAHGFNAIDSLAQSMRVAKTFHGHHHEFFDYKERRQDLGFHGFGVGLHGIADLSGTTINTGDLSMPSIND